MRHEDDILRFLFSQTEPVNSKTIAKNLRADNVEVSKALYHLRVDKGFVFHAHGKYNQLTPEGLSHCQMLFDVKTKQTAIAAANRSGEAMTEETATYTNEDDCSIETALQTLESRLKPKTIDDLQLKLDVLNRLSGFMDDSISEILKAIAIDLTE